MADIKHIQVFGAGMNLDSSDFALKPGETRAVTNMRYDNFLASNEYALSFIKSMLKLGQGYQPLPPGENEVIGASYYAKENSIVFIVYNSSGYHSIRSLSLDDASGAISVIAQQDYRGLFIRPDLWVSKFNFDKTKINHINFVGDLMFWVVPGRKPYCISIKAFRDFNNTQPNAYAYIDDSLIYAERRPPILPPITGYGDSDNARSTVIKGNVYSFRYAYKYFDEAISTTSPVSAISFPVAEYSGYGAPVSSVKNNVINVTAKIGAHTVKSIIFYVRVNNTGDWVRFKEIDRPSPISYTDDSVTVVFTGVEHSIPVDQNYVNSLYSRNPKTADSQEFIDEKYLVYGGYEDGMDGVVTDAEYTIHGEKMILPEVGASAYSRALPILYYSPGYDSRIEVYPATYTVGRYIAIKITKGFNPRSKRVYEGKVYVTELNQFSMTEAIYNHLVNNISWLIFTRDTNYIYVTSSEYSTVSLKETADLGEYVEVSAGGLKSGFATSFGIVYSDENGRVSGTNELFTINTPWYSDLLSAGVFNVDNTSLNYRLFPYIILKHKPPVWAKSYHIVVTRPLGVSMYFQTWADYVSVPGEESKPWVTISLWKYNNIGVSSELQSVNIRAYQYQKGDKIRFKSIDGGKTRFNTYVECDILGYSEGDEEGSLNVNRIRISRPSHSFWSGGAERPQLMIVEIFRPASIAEDNVYYETGYSFPILNPGTANRRHATNVATNQVEVIKMDMVNTFVHSRIFGSNEPGTALIRSIFCEDTSFSDFNVQKDTLTFGRTSVYNSSIKSRYVNALIYSEPYFDNTNINGLFSFSLTSRYKPVSEQDGKITGLRYGGYTLAVIQERNNQSIYVGRNGLSQASQDGADIVVSTDQVLASTYPSIGRYGCVNPESIIQVGRSVYYYDALHKAIVRRAPNGIIAITDKYGMRKELLDIAAIASQGTLKVLSGYNEKYGELYFSFNITGKTSYSRTLVFDEETNVFKFFIELEDSAGTPADLHAYAGDRLYSFMKGDAYLHDGGHGSLVLFDHKKEPSLEFVVNPEPLKTKVFNSIAILSNCKWKSDQIGDISVVPSDNNPRGMRTFIPDMAFKSEEGVFYSDIPGNCVDEATGVESKYNSINGEVMRGNTLRVKLKSDYDGDGYIAHIITKCSMSEISG